MKRHLAAVLVADICDYSRLMGEDSEAMLRALRRLRAELFGPSVASRRGRIVKNMGDGWIVLFGSAVDAVESAMQVQDRLATGAQPGEPEIVMRVGVHLGDVVEEDADVFGDGVNVAARLEAATKPGSVAISEAVFGSLDGTLRPSFDEAGVWELKNIARPVQVWVRGDQAEVQTVAGETSSKLTIAVRPVTTSDDRDEVRELADAITGDVSAYLGATMWLNATTAETSTGTDYVLLMGLRSRGNKLRLETQLLGAGDTTIRKDKFDGDLSDAFDWQDSVGEEISGLIMRTVFDAELVRLEGLNSAEMTANDFALRAMLAFETLDPIAMAAALKFASAALEKGPSLPDALAVALLAYSSSVSVGFSGVIEPYKKSLQGWLSAAEPLKNRYPVMNFGATFDGQVKGMDAAEHRRIIEKILRGASLDFVSLAFCGWSYVFLGMPEPALDCLHRALKLGGNTPWRLIILGAMGIANLQAGHYEKSIHYASKGLEISTGYTPLYRQLAAAHAQLGQMDEAKAALDTLLEQMPSDTVSQVQKRSNYADTPETRRYFDGLRLAGLPE